MAADNLRATSERVDGLTPHGGAYAIASYSDAAGRPCPRAAAARVEINEYDRAGNSLFRTYLKIGG
jgi:hypothetical protein